MRTTAVPIGLLLATCLAVPAGAAEAPEAIAARLARAQTPPESYDKLMQVVTAGLGPSLQASGSQRLDATRLMAVVRRALPYEDVVSVHARVLAKHFTAAEMRELLAFYDTPLGRKLVRKQPEVAGDAMAAVMPLMMRRMPAMLRELGKQYAPPPKGE